MVTTTCKRIADTTVVSMTSDSHHAGRLRILQVVQDHSELMWNIDEQIARLKAMRRNPSSRTAGTTWLLEALCPCELQSNDRMEDVPAIHFQTAGQHSR